MTPETKERIKKGYDFFYKLKPSEVKPIHILWLHEWLRLLSGEKKVEITAGEMTDDQLKEVFK